MNRYLFLLSWIDGCDSVGGEITNVRDQNDLWPQYLSGNKHIFAVEVLADSEDIAVIYGYERAWHDEYTAYDTVSTVVCLSPNYQHQNPVVVIKAHCNSGK